MTHVLVVAGHDSSGHAGLDADLDAARAAQCEATCVATARTRQDEHGVQALGQREPRDWLAEARAGLPAMNALKFGLLPGADHVAAAAELLADVDARTPLVLDPVLRSSSGFDFLDAAAREALLELLGPRALVWTPNLHELALLTGTDAEELAHEPNRRQSVAQSLLDRGARAVVVKGGHGHEDPVCDLVVAADAAPVWLSHERLPASIGGSGCRFATMLACHLARGEQLEPAARAAADFVAERIAAALRSSR